MVEPKLSIIIPYYETYDLTDKLLGIKGKQKYEKKRSFKIKKKMEKPEKIKEKKECC